MIIKSMSRKTPSFGQLIAYMADIDKSDEQYNVYRNLYSRKLEEMDVEFNDNARYMAKRKNGVFLYHEILSISVAKKITRAEQKAILREIAYKYAQKRAENNMIFGALHDDHAEHLHYHLIISANAVGEAKKTRLSKAQFDRFKKDIEQTVLDEYPQLEQQVIINREKAEKVSNKHGERQRRTKEPSNRDKLKAKLDHIFTSVKTKEELFTSLNSDDLEIYVRGQTIGVIDHHSGRKHRLKTLGVLDAFNIVSQRIELAETKQRERGEEVVAAENTTQKMPAGEKEKIDQGEGQEKVSKDDTLAKEDTNTATIPPVDEVSAQEKQQAQREQEIAELRAKQAESENDQHTQGQNKP